MDGYRQNRAWNPALADVEKNLEELSFAFEICVKAPKIVLTKSIYPNDDGIVERVKFILKPSKKAPLYLDELKKEFTLVASDGFYEELITTVVEWFDYYDDFVKMYTNIEALNEEFAQIAADNEIPYSVRFAYAFKCLIMDVSDTSIVLGLERDVIQDLADLPLFGAPLETTKEAYREKIAELLKVCARPVDVIKAKTLVTRNLGIWSRKDVKTELRQLVNRKIEFVTEGFGYKEDGGNFAIIEKVGLTKDQFAAAKTADEENVYIFQEAAGYAEKKKTAVKRGKEAIFGYRIGFRVSPFNLDTLEPATMALA
jgi:hypothetical protein